MYEKLKKEIANNRMNMMNIEDMLGTLEHLGINIEGENIKVTMVSGRILIRVTNDYQAIVEALQVLSVKLKTPFPFTYSWGGSTGNIMFSWNPEDIPIEIWGEFDPANIPEELSRGCEVKKIESTEVTYRLVCDV
jgi:hypothetical protein